MLDFSQNYISFKIWVEYFVFCMRLRKYYEHDPDPKNVIISKTLHICIEVESPFRSK